MDWDAVERKILSVELARTYAALVVLELKLGKLEKAWDAAEKVMMFVHWARDAQVGHAATAELDIEELRGALKAARNAPPPREASPSVITEDDLRKVMANSYAQGLEAGRNERAAE